MNRHLYTALLLLGFLLVTGCGGGGGGGGGGEVTTPNDLVKTGVFIDSPVANLKYRTDSQSGATNVNGEYFYKEGETVTFSIGGIDLPSVKAKALITPLDLVNTTDINDLKVVNVLRLLQSLDLDGNPLNGIEIGEAAHVTAQGMTLSFSSTDFETDVINLISNSGSTTTTLIDTESAKQHFQNYLNDLIDGDTGPCQTEPTNVNFASVAQNDGSLAPRELSVNDSCQSMGTDSEGNALDFSIANDGTFEFAYNPLVAASALGEATVTGAFAVNGSVVYTVCAQFASEQFCITYDGLNDSVSQ